MNAADFEDYRRQVEDERQEFGRDQSAGQHQDQAGLDELARRFRLLHIGEVVNDIRPPEYLIDGVIEVETLGEIFGDPGSCKTFVALSMLLSVASGEPWYGHAVKQGTVVYIVGEGRQGVARRLGAWGKHHEVNLATLPFFMSSAPAALTDPSSAAEVAEIAYLGGRSIYHLRLPGGRAMIASVPAAEPCQFASLTVPVTA